MIEPSQTCWHTPDVWLGSGVVTCGYLTAETDRMAFPSWEQGVAAAPMNVLPSLAEFQAIWEVVSDVCRTMAHAFEFNLMLLLINVIISLLGRAGPVCVTDVPPGLGL
jgi:hypothetical protein